jgi:N-methylhydantoinase A
LTVPAPNRKLDAAALAELERLFELEHERTYGHAFRGTYAMETVTLRATGAVAAGIAHASVRTDAFYRPTGSRSVYFGPSIGERETPILARDALGAGLRAGPLIVEEYEGTTVVPPDCAARLDQAGNIVIELGRPGSAA